MIKKTIKYHDYDGNEREDDFHFHLNQVEVTKLDGEFPGGLQNHLKEIGKNEDRLGLLKVIDIIISHAYGRRLPDGAFIKRAPNGLPLYEEFVNTEAYDNLLTDLLQNQDNVMNFLTGCMTKDAQDKIRTEWEKMKAEEANNVTLTPVK